MGATVLEVVTVKPDGDRRYQWQGQGISPTVKLAGEGICGKVTHVNAGQLIGSGSGDRSFEISNPMENERPWKKQ